MDNINTWFPDNSLHADYRNPLITHDLREPSCTTAAQGERPLQDLSEYFSELPRSLGDEARAYREEHKKAKKATIVWRP